MNNIKKTTPEHGKSDATTQPEGNLDYYERNKMNGSPEEVKRTVESEKKKTSRTANRQTRHRPLL